MKLGVQTVVGRMGGRAFRSVVRATEDAELADSLCSDVEHNARRKGDPAAFRVVRKVGE